MDTKEQIKKSVKKEKDAFWNEFYSKFPQRQNLSKNYYESSPSLPKICTRAKAMRSRAMR